MKLEDFIKSQEDYGAPGKSRVRVALCADRNFMRPLGITMTSVLKHNLGAEIYIFCDSIKEDDKQRLLRTVTRYEAVCHIFFVNMKLLEGFPTASQWSSAIYFRFFAAEAVQGGRLVYLDSDILCRKNLEHLWELNLQGGYLGAVEDTYDSLEQLEARWQRIGIPGGGKYFNSGMLLIDLDKWHEMNISERAIELLHKEPGRWRSPDQDVLNFLYHGKVCWLDKDYNLIQMKSMGSENTALVHFAGCKPWWWNGRGNKKFIDEYMELYQDSAWSDVNILSPCSVTDVRLLSKHYWKNGSYVASIAWHARYLAAKLFGYWGRDW